MSLILKSYYGKFSPFGHLGCWLVGLEFNSGSGHVLVLSPI